MYSYELKNNHYIIDIDGMKYLLDTGSRISFWINPECQSGVVIDNVRYPLHSRPRCLNVYETENLVKSHIDGFIGLDIIYQTSLTIYKNNKIDFKVTDIDGNKFSLAMIHNLPSVSIFSNDIKGYLLIDTGAMVGYGITELFDNRKPMFHVEDYNPTFGKLNGDLFETCVSFNENFIKYVDVCKNDQVSNVLKELDSILITNVTTFFDDVCVFDFEKRVLVLK